MKTVGAKQISGARKQELGNPILCNAAAAAASSSSPRRRTSSSFAFGEDDLDDDLDAPPLPRSPSDYALLLSEAEQRGDWVKAVELVAEARVLRVRLPAAGYEAAARAAAAADQGDWQMAASFLARAARGGGGGGGGGDEAGGDSLPPPPACSAIKEVFSRLAREVQAEAIMDLLDLLRGDGDEGKEEAAGTGDGAASSSSSSSPLSSSSPSSSSSTSPSSSWSRRPAETRSHALNCAARACARASSGGKKMMRATDSNSSSSSGSSREVPGQEEEESLSEEDRRIFFEASLSLLDDMREGDLKIEDGTFGSVALAALAMGEPELSEELLEERDYL